MELKSMSDFVLSRSINAPFVQRFTECENYANFLKQPLILSMFVPCGNNGEVLEEPSNYKEWNKKECAWWENYTECLEYQQAKKRCLFEGFELITEYDDYWSFKYKDEEEPSGIFKTTNVEYLQKVFDKITLTQSAINQITTTR